MIAVLARLFAWTLQALTLTCRYRIAGGRTLNRLVAENKPGVGAIFHGRMLCMFAYFTRPGRGPWTVMVSRSRDGERMSKVVRALGWSAVRGSTGRGGSGALVKAAEVLTGSGDNPRMCMTVDGSRGPRYVAKVGSLFLASRANGWVVCVQAAPSRCVVLRSTWDHTTIPLPWARISVVCSRPIYLSPLLDHAALARLLPRFQVLMEAQRRWVDARARRGPWK